MAKPPPPPEPAGSDPSMDDILASIRRILSDEEKAAKVAGPADGVFVLDPSMMVAEHTPSGAPEEEPHEPHAMTEPEPPPLEPPPPPSPPLPSRETASWAEPPAPEAERAPEKMREPEALPTPDPAHEPFSLVAPEAAAAAASSVGALMRTLAAERNTPVHRGGPTIEDLVREEIRPLLKHWLDSHLPPLVERLVRAEIERVVSRIAG